MKHILTGFGFGPIQSGIFVNEAFASGNFDRIIIAEIDQKLVDAVRKNNGTYYINVAGKDAVTVRTVDNIEMLNPTVEADRDALIDALRQSTELVTSLPSVKFYDIGDNSVASLIAQAIADTKVDAAIIYTAENNNHAAEILEEKVNAEHSNNVQFLNTVIGKMSQVVTDADEIKSRNLKPLAPGIDRAFLVEEFNNILVTKCNIESFKPGIEVLIEKEDLLPFEEAKLYGHNAIHATLAYLGAVKGYVKMSELKGDSRLMQIARCAFLNESGAALIKKYSHLGDKLFTEAGYEHYVEDLLERMTNPHLSDTVARSARDPLRKLGISDRIFGTMSLALKHGIEPTNIALGAMAGIAALLSKAQENKLPEDLCFTDWKKLDDVEIEKILRWIWHGDDLGYSVQLIGYVQRAKIHLAELLSA